MSSSSSSSLPIPTLKLLLIGSSSVGKSSLLLRFTNDDFLPPEESTATIGIDYQIKTITLADGRKFRLSLWDTAGQERFRTLTSSYYRGAQGVVVVYDVTSRESFEGLEGWFDELDTFAPRSSDENGPGVVRCLVGNKVDRDLARVVTEEEGREMAKRRGAKLFVEASAKEGRGVQEAFDELVEEIISTPALWQSQPNSATRPGDRVPGSVNLASGSDQGAKSGGCSC